MIKTFVLTSCRCVESILNPSPPPSTWLHHTWALAHIGEYVWTICAWTPNTFVAPSDETPSPFPSTCCGWFPPFHWWYPTWNGGYFRFINIYFCFGLFTTSFFLWPFTYDIWTFMRLFCPRWLCEWFRPFFWSIVQGYVPPWVSQLFFFVSIPSIKKVV